MNYSPFLSIVGLELNDSVRALELLKETDVDVERNNILHYCVKFACCNLLPFAVSKFPTLVNARNAVHRTPLHEAADVGCIKYPHLPLIFHELTF